MSTNLLSKIYRHVFIVQNRDFWESNPFPFDKDTDLVLSFDFAVVNLVNTQGGIAAYLDHLVDPDTMERYNYETYDFFRNWYRDKDGKDIFSYRGVEFGNTFRQEIWNDITYNVRLWINLLYLSNVEYDNIYVGVSDIFIFNILDRLHVEFKSWDIEVEKHKGYYFRIFQWTDEKIHPSGLNFIIKSYFSKGLDVLFGFFDFISIFKKKRINIYIHNYHPTRKIIKELVKNKKVTMISESFIKILGIKGITRTRRLPVKNSSNDFISLAKDLLINFEINKYTEWEIYGVNVSNYLYELITKRIENLLPEHLKVLDIIINFFSKRKLDLMVTITELGTTNCLMLNYCQKKNIPSYIIINGLLIHSFEDDAKLGTWINSYGESIKDIYFGNMENVVCLGDPRMDDYISENHISSINFEKPTIVIGASGYSPIDLNSYIAAEFDFLYDIMNAFRVLIKKGREMNLILKIRPNNYLYHYYDFLREYFPEIQIEILDRTPMIQVLKRADFYISIYSQTLFEASCLGIPVLYYKKDTQIVHPPFDGRSELVVASGVEDLIRKIELFYENNSIYNSFKNKKVMEKYIGPLDGRNLQRNLDFIYSLTSNN